MTTMTTIRSFPARCSVLVGLVLILLVSTHLVDPAEGFVASYRSTPAAMRIPNQCASFEDSTVAVVGDGDDDNDNDNNRDDVGRREFLNGGLAWMTASLAAAATTTTTFPSNAVAVPSQEDMDKQNVVRGYKRLQYLLNNWETETTVCGMGGDNLEKKCERTPLKVMEYMGYKATNDPLFKAEKTLRRLYPLVPMDKDLEFIDAVEAFAENADEASGMAFISSWGEANPGGGKDRVELFIERAHKNVIVASNSLETVIKILDLPL